MLRGDLECHLEVVKMTIAIPFKIKMYRKIFENIFFEDSQHKKTAII